jgi:hypothetical protein
MVKIEITSFFCIAFELSLTDASEKLKNYIFYKLSRRKIEIQLIITAFEEANNWNLLVFKTREQTTREQTTRD